MNFVVTGGSGFIGQNFIKYAKSSGHNILEVTRPNKEFSKNSIPINHIDFQSTIHNFKPNYVIDLATHFTLDPVLDSKSELVSGSLIFHMILNNSMKEFDVPWIYAASYWQKLRNSNGTFISDYHFLKKVTEEYLRANLGSRLTTVILMDTYGPFDTRSKIVNYLMNYESLDKKIELSEGYQLVNLIHVEDVIESLLTICNMPQELLVNFESFNLISEEYVTLRDLVSKIEFIRECRLPIEWGVRPYRAGEILEKPDFIRSVELGAEKYSLDSGLRNLHSYGR